MKVNSKIRRRTIVYFSIITILLVFTSVSLMLDLQNGLDKRHWRNGPGNTAIGEITTLWDSYPITPEGEDSAIALARDENGEVTVKGMPLNLFAYGVGEDFVVPEHWGFKAGNAMRIVSYCMSIALIICFIFILLNFINGFRNGIYFSRLQVRLLRWSALLGFLLFISNELCSKFNMTAIGQLYGKTSEIKLATVFQLEIHELLIPLLLLIFAEIINIALHLNEEESMTI